MGERQNNKQLEKLRKIEKIQSIYNSYEKKGVKSEFIWREYIYPEYRVSYSSFWRYVKLDVGKEWQRILEKMQKKQR